MKVLKKIKGVFRFLKRIIKMPKAFEAMNAKIIKMSETTDTKINDCKFLLDNQNEKIRQLLAGTKEIYQTDNKVFYQYKEHIRFFANKSELFIVDEIFRSEFYNIPSEENYVIMDIGANIGLSILYFLGKYKNLEHIYAYEPVKSTFESLKTNLSLNSEIVGNVTVFHAGVGRESKLMKICSHEFTPASTLFFNAETLPEGSIVEETMVKGVLDEFYQIREKHPKNPMVLKLDAEGVEFEIVEELYNHDLLKEFDYMFIEFHERKFDELPLSLLQEKMDIMNIFTHDINVWTITFINKKKSYLRLNQNNS